MKHINTPDPEGESRVSEMLARIRSKAPRASALPETRVAKLIRLARDDERRKHR
ncbi:hypothetical protein [Azoarcus taiwanensis]|uniref:Uncharacterized protein n=1 Tax=Azoarcus taiwanensis TaxID=666964 RepID=A0A972FG68_9RHOO|nr:hypothetical protein [Azoarcus taiwanensis]NMG04110.1 hypothetical protein [Azoarcus taiwanensis]